MPASATRPAFDVRTVLWVAVVVVAAIAVCLAVPLSIRSNQNSIAAENVAKDQNSLVSQVDLQLRIGYQTVFSGVLSLESYVIGAMQSLPNNTNLNATERVHGQSFASFSLFAASLSTFVNGLKSMQLQPGGVINQVYPAGSGPLGLDLLYRNTSLSPSLLANILDGSEIYLDGPRAFSQGGFGFLLRKLVYNPNTTVRSLDTWWGTAAVLIEWDPFLNASGLAIPADAELVMYTTATGIIFYRSKTVLWNDTTALEAHFASRAACTEAELPQGRSWTLCIALPSPVDYFSTDVVFAIIFIGTFGPILLGALCFIVIWVTTRVYDGRGYAPKMVPLVYTWIGIHRADRLWDLDSDAMERIRDEFALIVRNSCETVHGYLVEEMVGCYSIATRSIDASVHFGFLVAEALEARGLSIADNSFVAQGNASPMSTVLSPKNDDSVSTRSMNTRHRQTHAKSIINIATNGGGAHDGKIKLCCLVHLCQDATVVFDAQADKYRYEGADILQATKLFGVCRPNLISLSHATARHAKTMRDVEVVTLPPVLSKSSDAFVVLVAAIDTRNRSLWQRLLADSEQVVSQESRMARPDGNASAGKNPFTRRRSLSTLDVPRSMRLATNMSSEGHLQQQVDPTPSGFGGAMMTAMPQFDAYWSNWATISQAVSVEKQDIMKKAFEYQAFLASKNLSYEGLKGIFVAFYLAFGTLFHAFAEAERKNIFRRLVQLFGVPPAGDVIEHLAVRCAIIAMGRVDNDVQSSGTRSPTNNSDPNSDADE